MRAFIKHVKKQFVELDHLAAVWENLDSPLDTVRYLIGETADRAARLGLSDLFRAAPDLDRLTFKEAKWYLSECLRAGPPEPEGTTLTVTEVAARLKVSRDKVLGWIHYGRLRAANTAKGALGRPRYRIKPADLDDFLAGRTGA